MYASIAKLLYDGFHVAVPNDYSVRQDQPLTLRDSEPEPALAIVRGSVNDYRSAHPHSAALVVEIAINSLNFDREKAALYAEAGVDEYRIVIPSEKHIEVYTRPRDGAYLKRTVVDSAVVTCASVPGIRVNLRELF